MGLSCEGWDLEGLGHVMACYGYLNNYVKCKAEVHQQEMENKHK